jgi:hypothetical protein
MTDDRIISLVAMLALLLWLLGGRAASQGQRRTLHYLAYGLLAAGILYALFLTAMWFAG